MGSVFKAIIPKTVTDFLRVVYIITARCGLLFVPHPTFSFWLEMLYQFRSLYTERKRRHDTSDFSRTIPRYIIESFIPGI